MPELRSILLGSDSPITEAVKWNAPRSRTTGHFATLQQRSPKSVHLIPHFGAKKRALPTGAIADPGRMADLAGRGHTSLRVASQAELAATRRRCPPSSGSGSPMRAAPRTSDASRFAGWAAGTPRAANGVLAAGHLYSGHVHLEVPTA